MQNSTNEQADLFTCISTSSSNDGTVPSIPGTYCDLDNGISGTKRKLQINDVRPEPCGYDSVVRPDPCGYDSDTEQDDTTHGRKRKKLRSKYYTCTVQQSLADRWSNGHKRKIHAERSNKERRKKCKLLLSTECGKTTSCNNESSSSSDSSSDLSSNSSSDSQLESSSDSSTSSDSSASSDCSSAESSTSSNCSSSDSGMLTDEESNVARIIRKYLKPVRRIISCPDSCACVAGQSRPPSPIGRRGKVVEPLYKKLLQRRLLSLSNVVPHACCSRNCYVKWARKRISLYRMFRDYDKSDLRVDNYSWGQWKPEPEDDD